MREKAGSLAFAAQTVAAKETANETTGIRKALLIRVAAGFAVVLILLLFWHIRYYGYVPILQKPHKYAVDPASVSPRSAR